MSPLRASRACPPLWGDAAAGARRILAFAAAVGLAWAALPVSEARACGCVAAPSPAVPVVQAGERILFAYADGTVTAHIQIQYDGDPDRFGWLVPLPSFPEVSLGVDSLFAQLIAQTQPVYQLQRQPNGLCAFNEANDGSPTNLDGRSGGRNGVVAVEGSIGAFDYAVLKADEKQPMLDWLNDNRYVVPEGTDAVVDRYIFEGAYFLAVKLKSGNGVRDIQPIVVAYESDNPMIPIVLTSVAALEDMPITSFVLGDSRAIPRNYRHTIINLEKIDWFNAGQNYNDVIIAATNEAEDGQSFITEYAGTSAIMQDLLFWPGRFGDRDTFETETEAGRFVRGLRTAGFTWTPQLIAILERTFPFPTSLLDEGITSDEYYQVLDYYLNGYRDENPAAFDGVDLSFDAAALTQELWERIVEPSIAADALFDMHPKLTRLYTTLSPLEMTRDPVFSFNPSLPDVSNIHTAIFETDCGVAGRGVLTLPDGRRFSVDDPTTWVDRSGAAVPFSRRIERLRLEGGPLVEVDNTALISASDADQAVGCHAGLGPANAAWLLLVVLPVALVLRRRGGRERA